jgi:diketogulonate reductase-like aldo/keto reductase
LKACEASLKKLRREAIDYYQLHSARMQHLQRGMYRCNATTEQQVK